MRRCLHFLLQFTRYPLLRNPHVSLQLWAARFTDCQAALRFPFLPTEMRAEVESLLKRPRSRSAAATGLVRSKLLPAVDSIWDMAQLRKQNVSARKRADSFFKRGLPNRLECNLLKRLLQQGTPELASFPYLFLYKWMPSTMIGQGDAVFADGRGRLSVVEGKAKQGTSQVTRQSHYYAERLREEFPEASVSAAILTNGGFSWVTPPEEPQARPSRRPTVADANVASGDCVRNVHVFDGDLSEQDDDGGSSAPAPSIGGDRLLSPSRLEQLEAMVVERELKPLLRYYGLRLVGRKELLVERILEHERASGVPGGF